MSSRGGYGQDALLVSMGFFALASYHSYLVYMIRNKPMRTTHGFNQLGRKLWVQEIMRNNEKKDVLGVQQLRNTIMEVVLMATVSVLMCTGITVFVNTPYGSRRPATDYKVAVVVKVLMPLAFFMFSFFCCMQSVILVTQVSFLINVPPENDESLLTNADRVARVLLKAFDFHAVGSRSFAVAVPFLLWIFGPIPVLMASVIMLLLFYFVDIGSSKSSE